jgi:hypothetical protein
MDQMKEKIHHRKNILVKQIKQNPMKRFLIVLLVLGLYVTAFTQELPEQYREKFSESDPIRKEQHPEIKSYINLSLDEELEKSMNFFQPDFFSISDYENSLYPYRQQLGNYFGYPPPKASDGRIARFEKAGEDTYSVIYRVWIEVVEKVHTYGLFMVPKSSGPKEKSPMLIAMHGGSGNPEAICGLDTRINYHSFGYEAVKRGYIVWAPGLTMLSS